MKKFFFFAVALLTSATMFAEISIEICTLDSTKLAELNGGPIATKSYTEATIPAGTVLLDGNDMKVTVPFDQTFQWVGAAQPNGAHKKIGFGNLNTEISMVEGIQGKDNPKDADGQNPCNILAAPTQGAAFAINAKVDGWIVVLHKGSSNKQYFAFENGSPLGYELGLMTYADPSLGEDGLLKLTLAGDPNNFNYLTKDLLLANTGFDKIAMVEDYFNDTLTSGIAWENYKQNGVCAIAFPAFKGCNYLVGGAGTKMTAAAIVFVKGLDGTLPIVAKGETITEEGKDPVVYNDVTLVTLYGVGDGIENVNESVKAQKVISNGQVLIIKEGVAYTVLGTVAK